MGKPYGLPRVSDMGFTNVLWTVVFAGSAAYIARKDLGKIFRVLKRPTENFLKEVKAEMDAPAVSPPKLSDAPPKTVIPPPTSQNPEPPVK